MSAMSPINRITHAACLALLSFGVLQDARSQVLWTVGIDDNGWPCPGTETGAADACFLQENGAVNALPGDPYALDNDYYLSGEYYFSIASVPAYDTVGWFGLGEGFGEINAERAFTTGDIEQRYHFNLPADLQPTDLLSVTFDANNLDESDADPRFGVAVLVNGVEVQPQIVIRPAQLDVDYTTPAFTLASVNAEVGAGPDNVLTLKGTAYNTDGGGNWMGIDYVQLNRETTALPKPAFPWSVGSDDDAWTTGDGGGANATFVAGDGVVNDLPGSPTSTETAGGADNDYYFTGQYDNVIAANGAYAPVGLVSANEEAAEGGFAGDENELRYHFNLPNTLQMGDLAAVSFDALSLDTNGSDPRYGVEVYVNGVQVGTEVIVREAQLDRQITTPAFSLSSVNVQLGLGYDNIVTLRGISYSAEGGGDSLTLDQVRLKPMPFPPVLPWSVGRNDNAHPAGDGGGASASFVQENGVINPLPGVPNSPEVDQQADNDYYFAGVYSDVIAANGDYQPVGDVPANEEAAERAFAGADNDLRYHFNLPAGLSPDTPVTFSFDALSLDTSGADPRYGAEVYVNNVLVQSELVIRQDQLNRTFFTDPFSLADVEAQVGQGYDNIVSLRGINYNADGGGNWMGFDYVRLDPVLPPPFPLQVNKDNNGHGGGVGGGPNALMVQEAGTNELPGSPASPEANQLNDDDYYFAGDYTTVIPKVVEMYGAYEPVGTVLVNEYAAERAFAGSDNEMRFHFNLPDTLQPTDELFVSFDALDLDGSGASPQYGVELYVNGVLLQAEQLITPAELDVDYTVGPFTLASVGAEVGSGFDNIVTLRGINHSADGGGNWMGVDYLQVDPMPEPVFPWAVGRDDNEWPAGDGGAENATFVQEANVNDLPGNPKSPETNQQADDDYYLAGVYTSVIPANGAYAPVGYVVRNEEAAERAFAGTDNNLRYHFNLPTTLQPTDEVVITFDALNLDEGVDIEDPRYGIEIYVNGTLVQSEITIRPEQLDVDYSTEPFTLASVNANLGAGSDNIVTLKGINYSAEGGGNWMGIDYVQFGGLPEIPPEFTEFTVSAGKLTLTWTGDGALEWAPSVDGPWTAISPTPSSPYTEDVILTEKSRFYRLKQP